MKLELLDRPIAPVVLDPLLAAWRSLVDGTGALTAVRSSALVEDRDGSSFAGQFESYLGLECESDFITAVRGCWAALWSTRALRYMATHGLDPADTAMAVLDPAAGARPRVRRRIEPDRRRRDAGERDVGAGILDCAR